MTELEQQLLSAFDSLQNQHEKQHKDFVTSYNGLVQMFESTSKENKELRHQVSNLSRQVEHLSAHLLQLEKHYNKNNR
ncbi:MULTISPECIES: MbeD family mobilization/exclusion protein [Vibrio]|uniref:MbeD family mobilization/exclusion protein n=1 Tax=Vibrio gigantis TaxID=296199 RepID=A0A5M9N145_9VIBR|nr:MULTISPECIES: MbeD family mobilization/exclusion protein [Vibrio]KAA8663461.1 MbeD family mobilization/exclusion protein [Vibrio gigantis]